MAKEHWTKRIKRENSELKTENAELKTENSELKRTVGAVNTDKGDSTAARPDGLIISLTDKGVNEIREANNAQRFDESAHLAILADDEVEIRVESRHDFNKYCQFAASRDIVGYVNPEPSWSKATQYTREWLEAHNNLSGMRITVFDPYGFMKQFPGLNIVKTHTEHEWWRTDEGMRKLEDADIQRQIAEFEQRHLATPSWWRVLVRMDHTLLEGKTIASLHAAAMGAGSPHPARLMQRIKDSIFVDYHDGDIHDRPICGFQYQGDYGKPPADLKIDIACSKGQNVSVHFAGKLDPHLRKEFVVVNYEDDTHSPTRDHGGSSISFTSQE